MRIGSERIVDKPGLQIVSKSDFLINLLKLVNLQIC